MRIGKAAALAAATLGSSLLGAAPSRAQQLDTVNLVGCAVEGGVCRMPYPTNVYYGVPGKTNGRPFPNGGVIPCNSQTFGDPAPNQAKSCWYAPRLATRRGVAPAPARDDDYDDRRRDDYRDRRDYDRPPVRRPYDDGYASERRRYRDDRDED